MKWEILVLIVAGLGYYGVTLPDGIHYRVGFTERQGLHLLTSEEGP